MINLTPRGIANGEGAKSSTIKRKLKIGPISLNFVTIIIIALITLFYLAQTQIGTSKKSQISELENQKEELQREIERLEVEAADVRSMNNIEKDVGSLGMIPIQKIIYIVENGQKAQ
jgi:hypothetical protein